MAARSQTTRSSGGFPPLELVVFAVGAAALGTEIASARLMAPFFGASTIVWANTIGVVLVSLSLGYWLGGRFADRHPTKSGLCALVLVAALAVALIPFAADPFLNVSVDALESVEAGAFVGSLLAVTVLVAPPVVLLGAVSPYAVRLAVDRVETAGAITGRLYAISTAGSLFGTFLSALLLIPAIGTRRTFLVFGFACAVVALTGITARRRRLALLVPATILMLIALPVGGIKASGGATVIAERETPYQYARVTQTEDGTRRLELNEGQAVHSIYRPGRFLAGGYWDELLVAPFAALREPARSVAILGNAGGTTARAYGHYFPRSQIDAVEIDGALSDLGRRYFDMHNPRMRLYEEDARPFLRRVADRRYDVIMVDAYRQPYVPFYLTTREFFDLTIDRLAPSGVLLINVGHPPGEQQLEKALSATLTSSYTTVLRDPSQAANTILVATNGRASQTRLRARVGRLPAELRPLARATASRLRPPLEGGSVYSDDRAPVEWLIDKSIVSYAASNGQ